MNEENIPQSDFEEELAKRRILIEILEDSPTWDVSALGFTMEVGLGRCIDLFLALLSSVRLHKASIRYLERRNSEVIFSKHRTDDLGNPKSFKVNSRVNLDLPKLEETLEDLCEILCALRLDLVRTGQKEISKSVLQKIKALQAAEKDKYEAVRGVCVGRGGSLETREK
jgi:hypothetical protein